MQQATHSKQSRFGPAYDDRTDAVQEREKRMIANVMHLVDLKRAGHSPTRTELKITPDAITPRYAAYQESRISMTGSHADMCASIA